MTIEIQQPELEAFILERMQSGAFGSVEEFLRQALLNTSSQAAEAPARQSPTRSGREFIQALMDSPHKETELECPSFFATLREIEPL